MNKLTRPLIITIALLMATAAGASDSMYDSQSYLYASNYLYAGQNAYAGASNVRTPVDNGERGLLEQVSLSFGTIFSSRHFKDEDYNETHNGIYLNINNWTLGTYENSGYATSNFITYNANLYQRKAFAVNLVTGVADGYEGWEYARNGYAPIVGVSAQWMSLKTIVSPEFVAFGVEVPLN